MLINHVTYLKFIKYLIQLILIYVWYTLNYHSLISLFEIEISTITKLNFKRDNNLVKTQNGLNTKMKSRKCNHRI